MAFVDEVTIYAKAGDGGDGVVRFRHEKFIERGGPSGGNGGNGGNVYARAVRNVHLLAKYRTKQKFRAENGKNGGKKSLHGEDGRDIEILFPVGSIITNTGTKEEFRLDSEDDRVLLLHGGRGGLGNEHFKSSTNVTPRESTPGKKGEEGTFFVEVELIADIGFIGLPSAGKTSLLNALTHAHGKVGAYPFTTLEPNLGECSGRIIADIPGLISGASEGKGLGHAFLRHIRRTKILVHLVSVEQDDVVEAYHTIRRELDAYDPELALKKEIIVLSKTDIQEDENILHDLRTRLRGLEKEVYTVTIKDPASVDSLRKNILKTLQ